MSMTIVLGLAALAVVLVLALVAVGIARNMDKAGSGKAASGKGDLTAQLEQAFAIASRSASAPVSDEKKAKTKKQATSAAIISVVALLAVGVGIFSEGENDGAEQAAEQALPTEEIMPPTVETELAAGELHGLMLSPAPTAPVVLIIPGSGPTDRDGNNPLGVKAGSYRLLAEALAQRGVASVRVDKHGMYSSAASGDANAATVESYAGDYRAWIDAIRAETGQPCIWVLGHSEGALMATAAAGGRSDVCGLVLVSGMGRKLGPVLREQLAANPANAPLLEAANAAIDRIEAGQRVDPATLPGPLRALFPEAVQGFLISAFAADPVAQLKAAALPALIVQGSTDLQVTMEDAELLAQAPNARLVVIEGMNHVLKPAPENRLGNLAAYADPSLPLSPGIADAIVGFVLETR
jgi:pimeloyl-ACP methyl ester carboxylesterase